MFNSQKVFISFLGFKDHAWAVFCVSFRFMVSEHVCALSAGKDAHHKNSYTKVNGVAGWEGNDSATHLIFRDVLKRMHMKGGEKSHSLSHLFHVQVFFERNFSSRFHWLNFYKRKHFTSRLRLYSGWRRKKGEAFNKKHSRRGDVESACLCVHENKHLSTKIYSAGYARILCQQDAHTLLFMFCLDFAMTQHFECG